MNHIFIAIVIASLSGLCATSYAAPAVSDGAGLDPGRSIITQKPNDPRAVYLSDFGAVGDGKADDAPAIQRALDSLVEDHGGQGIVFVPEGTYRLGSTINIWRGVRLIGYGQNRPTFVLGANTPGFQDGQGKYAIHFRQSRPGEPLADARNDTFASGIINLNVRIEPGNPAASAIRYNVAQLCVLSYMEIDAGDADTGVEQIGNQIDNCRFVGGKYGLRTGRTSPGWQGLVIDCTFENQSVAAIQTNMAGMTVIRCHFANAPTAILIPEGGNEHLYVRDTLMDGISQAAIVCDSDQRPVNKINVQNVICLHPGAFVKFREGNKELRSDQPAYVVKSLCSGLQIDDAASAQPKRFQGTRWEHTAMSTDQLPAMPASDVPPLPPQEQWANIVELGAKGDGKTDDTEAFKKAIADHKVIYMPCGRYLISDTLELKADTMLIGLHCRETLFVGAAGPAFANADAPKAMVVAPKDGTNLVRGIGWASERNPGTVHLKWQAGAHSALDDAFFSWGGGRSGEGAKYGLWVDGGGGAFRNIWAPNNYATSGMFVSDTDVPGRVYLISVEHHNQTETVWRNVRGWFVCDLQTETIGGGEQSLAADMTNCQDIEFVNLFTYRSSGLKVPSPYAVKLDNCRDITFLGVHNFSGARIPYTSVFMDVQSHKTLDESEVARVTVRPRSE